MPTWYDGERNNGDDTCHSDQKQRKYISRLGFFDEKSAELILKLPAAASRSGYRQQPGMEASGGGGSVRD